MVEESRVIYVLDLNVKPGGARMNTYSYLATKEEVKQELMKQLENPYLPVWYGLTAMLNVCELNKGDVEIIETFDVLPYVEYQIADFAPIKFEKSGEHPIGYHESEYPEDEGPINFESKDVNEVSRYLWGNNIDAKITINDAIMNLSTRPEYKKDVLPKKIEFEEYTLTYGHNDFS